MPGISNPAVSASRSCGCMLNMFNEFLLPLPPACAAIACPADGQSVRLAMVVAVKPPQQVKQADDKSAEFSSILSAFRCIFSSASAGAAADAGRAGPSCGTVHSEGTVQILNNDLCIAALLVAVCVMPRHTNRGRLCVDRLGVVINRVTQEALYCSATASHTADSATLRR